MGIPSSAGLLGGHRRNVPAAAAAVLLLLATLWILLTNLLCCAGRRQSSDERPLSAFRLALLRPVSWCCRSILFVMGVFWIEERYPK